MHLGMESEGEAGYVFAQTESELEAAVYEKYPETEERVPLENRKGSIPDGIREEIEELARKQEDKLLKKSTSINGAKSTTPGDKAQSLEA